MYIPSSYPAIDSLVLLTLFLPIFATPKEFAIFVYTRIYSYYNYFIVVCICRRKLHSFELAEPHSCHYIYYVQVQKETNRDMRVSR